jgi:hypothetical protein
MKTREQNTGHVTETNRKKNQKKNMEKIRPASTRHIGRKNIALRRATRSTKFQQKKSQKLVPWDITKPIQNHYQGTFEIFFLPRNGDALFEHTGSRVSP